MTDDFPEFNEAYNRALLPDNPDQFGLLAAKAHFNIYHSNLWHGTAHRFAEMIVLECIRYFNEDYVRDFDTLWREDLSKSLKEHFGVE